MRKSKRKNMMKCNWCEFDDWLKTAFILKYLYGLFYVCLKTIFEWISLSIGHIGRVALKLDGNCFTFDFVFLAVSFSLIKKYFTARVCSEMNIKVWFSRKRWTTVLTLKWSFLDCILHKLRKNREIKILIIFGQANFFFRFGLVFLIYIFH